MLSGPVALLILSHQDFYISWYWPLLWEYNRSDSWFFVGEIKVIIKLIKPIYQHVLKHDGGNSCFCFCWLLLFASWTTAFSLVPAVLNASLSHGQTVAFWFWIEPSPRHSSRLFGWEVTLSLWHKSDVSDDVVPPGGGISEHMPVGVLKTIMYSHCSFIWPHFNSFYWLINPFNHQGVSRQENEGNVAW